MVNYFSDKELACKCGKCDSSNHMDPVFMDRLNELRAVYGAPMYLTSAYRCPEHNEAVGGAPNSPHTKGIAVDVLVSGQHAHRLTKLAFKYGFTGIGVKQSGEYNSRFIHLDTAPMGNTRPRIWSY